MRDTESIAPAWEGEEAETVLQGTGPVGAMFRSLTGATRKLSPPLFHWLSGKSPEFKLAWGASEYALRFDGIHKVRRRGNHWGDNPRSNYNEAVERRQNKSAK